MTHSSRWGSAAAPADVFDAPEAEVSNDQATTLPASAFAHRADQALLLLSACICAQATELFVNPFDIAGVSPLAWRELQVRTRFAHGKERSAK